MRWRRSLAGGCATMIALLGCEPCAGTVACRTEPTMALSGRVIEHRTGKPAPGVVVSFHVTSDRELAGDSAVATSDADGYFRLSLPALRNEVLRGDLRVVPSAPFDPYTVKGFAVPTSSVRGDGLYVGNLVVDPYYLFVGQVLDRKTLALVPGATVTFEQTAGPRIAPDTFTQNSDADARVFRELRVYGMADIHAMMTVAAPGYPRAYHVPLRLQARYLDAPGEHIDVMKLGAALPYFVQVLRRGSGQFNPGARVRFQRLSGIRITPDSLEVAVKDSSGVVEIKAEPLDDGVLLARITIIPPAPYATEVHDAALSSTDADTLIVLQLGYGAQLYSLMNLVYRHSGAPVDSGIQVGLYRRAGLPIIPDGQLTLVDSLHRFRYTAATPDTGSVTADVEVRLRWPFEYDTIRLTIPARSDSTPTLFGTRAVGRWLPWRGIVLDDQTGGPIANATVEFHHTSGVAMTPDASTTTTDASGTFRLTGLPLRDGEVIGTIRISFAATYRDTTIADVHLTTSKDDTVRYLPLVRASRRP